MKKRNYETWQGIEIVLAAAKTPLSSVQIAEQLALLGVNSTTTQVAAIMLKAIASKTRHRHIARMPADKTITGLDHTRFAYYNPQVMNPYSYEEKPKGADTAPSKPDLRPQPEPFVFNPIPEDLDPRLPDKGQPIRSLEPAQPSPDASIAVPSEVKSITLAIGSVTIWIKLNS